MLKHDPNKDWEKYGEDDPYFAVVSLDRFQRDNLNPELLTEFFETGRQHIEYVLSTIRSHVDPNFKPGKALDFGCGVGRCTIPMAQVCKSVTGVDVSTAMLKEGEKNAASKGLTNIEWVHSNDLGAVKGSFNFVHSFIVFQHIPEENGLAILSKIVDLLADDGIGSLHFLYNKDTSRFKQFLGRLRVKVPLANNFANLFYGRPFGYPLVQKNAYSLNKILNLLQKKKCGNCHIRLEGIREFQGAVVFFQKRPDAVPYDQLYK